MPPALQAASAALHVDPSLEQRLADALADPAPHRLDDGNAIRAGFDAELDAERGLRDESRRVLATLQLDYAQRYGVASLKIRHHAQLGYVIEAPAAAVEKLRDFPELTLRQGMANGARFTTPELADLDRRIAEAGERAASRERAVFAHLVQAALTHADALAACADALAFLDAVQSAAKLAEAGTWCRPAVTDGDEFLVKSGRHPVVEAALAGHAAFVPNDCDLSPEQRVLLLTGPNMAGKSTFLRQNALIAVLAQAGLPVPAERATIGVVDRLFSRVGAADDLARGRSTFMVEMTETAAILHPGRAALAGRGGRDRPRHRDTGRPGDRLGGAGGAALGDPLPYHFRHTFPRACRTRRPAAAAQAPHHAGEGMERDGGIPARSGRRRGRALLGRPCSGTGRGAGAGGAPGRVVAGVVGKAWRAAGGGRLAAHRIAPVCHSTFRLTFRWPNRSPIST